MSAAHHLVIGAGLAGAATAWCLARDGHRVTLVERTEPAAADGSSHGSARIVRQAYTDPFYAELVGRARLLFTALEHAADTTLITDTESLDFGSTRAPRRLRATLDQLGVASELLAPERARERWPGVRFDTEVLVHRGMGVLDAESAVRAMVRLAVDAGAEFLARTEIERVVPGGGGYTAVTAAGEEIAATGVVVAVGGWIPDLLDRLPLPEDYRRRLPGFTVSQEQVLHFPYADGSRAEGAHADEVGGAAAVWPTTIHHWPGSEVYSLPGGRDAEFRGQKVSRFNGGRVIASAARQHGDLDRAGIDELIAYVTEWLPGLVPEPYAPATCLFTHTPSEDFLIDAVDGITLLSPCSGHGAKFAPLIGQLAAAVATGATPERRFTAAHLSSLAATGIPRHG